MCVSYCARRGGLYFNHADCPPQLCPFAPGPFGRCTDCRHRHGRLCDLTRAPLPPAGGCCHWNVSPAGGRQVIDLAMLTMLGLGANETVAEVLAGFDLPFQVDQPGRAWLDPAALSLPDTYGRGTECG